MARWMLAERFKWTLDQVDALRMSDLWELHAIDEARGKARTDEQTSANNFKAQGATVK